MGRAINIDLAQSKPMASIRQIGELIAVFLWFICSASPLNPTDGRPSFFLLSALHFEPSVVRFRDSLPAKRYVPSFNLGAESNQFDR